MDAPMPPAVQIEYQGRVAVLRFANPPANIINTRLAEQLRACLEAVLMDDLVAVVVLTGMPGHFIRHAEVAEIARAAAALEAGRTRAEDFIASPFSRLLTLLDEADKPVIAAIDGPCMGGGLEVALACTARVAADELAHIGLPEIRIGLFPGAGGTLRLARVLGPHRARLFILQGSVVSAREALAMGLVDEIHAAPLTRSLALAHDWAVRPRAAVRAIMQLCGPRAELEHHSEEQRCFAGLLQNAEALACLQRFLDGGGALEEQD